MSIKVNNLFYTYNKKEKPIQYALKDVSLEIKESSFVAFLGHTGSGKSTLIQNLNALLTPTFGEVHVNDFVVKNKRNKHIKKLRKHVGIVFQFPEYQLFEETVEKDVAFGPKNFGLSKERALEKAHEALLSVGLDESYFKRSPFDLSGGEKRRVAIAGILAIEPDILVLDEPTAGLDPIGSKVIMSLLCKLHEQGKTIILVTHDMDVVNDYVEHVYVLKDSLLAYEGKPKDLFTHDNEELAIETPTLYEIANKLVSKGFNIDIKNINKVDDLIKAIEENIHG